MESDPATTITDVAVMRALAHPTRITLLDHLSNTGPATATECAELVALTPSATSYHLRALAKAGLVEQAPGRGDGRERFWRSRVGSYSVRDGPETDPEVREAKRELVDSFVSWEEARTRQYIARSDEEPQEWRDATIMNGSTLLVTAEELKALADRVLELLGPYRKRTRANAPPEARTVSSLFRAFPTDTPLRS